MSLQEISSAMKERFTDSSLILSSFRFLQEIQLVHHLNSQLLQGEDHASNFPPEICSYCSQDFEVRHCLGVEISLIECFHHPGRKFRRNHGPGIRIVHSVHQYQHHLVHPRDLGIED